MTAGLRPKFAPVPLRAYQDKALKSVDLRVLAAIAAHDRFNSNLQACWASNDTLAKLADCHRKSVSRSITRLMRAGYLRNLADRPGRLRSRSRQLIVLYTLSDDECMKRGARPPAPNVAPSTSNNTVTPSLRGGYLQGNAQATQIEKVRNIAEAAIRSSSNRSDNRPVKPLDVLDGRADANKWLIERLTKERGCDIETAYAILRKIPKARGN